MTNLNTYIGKRVRLSTDVEHYPIGIFKAGLEGTVSSAQDDGPTADQ